MLEILISLIMWPVLAAKRRRNKNFAVIHYEVQGALTTLGDETVIVVSGPTLTHDFYAISADVSVEVRGLTAGEGSPMEYGASHSDYTVTEINENLDSSLTGPAEDMLAQEQSRRKVRRGGYLKSEGEAQTRLTTQQDRVRIPLKFKIAEGKTLSTWVKNKSGSALTTGGIQEWIVDVYGRWVA